MKQNLFQKLIEQVKDGGGRRQRLQPAAGESNQKPAYTPRNPLTDCLLDNMLVIRQRLDNSADLNVREILVGNIAVCVLTAENMVNLDPLQFSMITLAKTFEGKTNTKPDEIYHFFEQELLFGAELSDAHTIDEVFTMMLSGFMIVLIDGMSRAIVIGAQGFPCRSVSEPSSEVNVRGSKEGFVEVVNINMSLIRRRIKSEKLKFEALTLGDDSKTNVKLVYLKGVASEELLQGVRNKLAQIKSNIILNSGNLQPFLETSKGSVFSGVGYTERPDTLCYKINEGRIGILVDGTPFALVLPYLFSENFHSIDDADQKPYYTSMVRMLKYLAFLISILLPGVYIATGMYHPELFPPALLLNIVSSQQTTPFSFLTQVLFIQVSYELMREAGLRIPKPMGHAVGLIGSLVIGEAAVTSGLVASSMIMVVALTALSSYVVPTLQEPGTALRFFFIFLGGYAGLYGVALLMIVVLINASALTAFGVPYLAPITPFHPPAMRDTIVRLSHKKLQETQANVKELTGAHIKGN